ncbi:MAG TPA: FGGY-family carbohydrate kinase [Gemmatales bacterium]|nr:FGGY-family carbohydrate kinase [Gemmatales bacterium]HMP58092.1 FGGY-family carbohydrate kinase [Gemmatales bacterium]
MAVLALDVGTSVIKAAAIAPTTGELVGPLIREACPLENPGPDQAVVDPFRLWDALVKAASAAAAGHTIEGIGLATFTPGLILLDERDEPLTPIITHLDRRSQPEAREIERELGPAFLESTGNRPLPGGISAVVFQHLHESQPELRRRLHRYLHVNGWICLKLTGVAAFDPANACFTGLCSLMAEPDWSPRWCAYFGVAGAWLPPILPGNLTVGYLHSQGAEALGLPEGTPVKLGVPDTTAALLAAGAQRDDLLHMVGTTQVLAVLTDAPSPHSQRLTRHLGVGRQFVHVVHNPVGGVALEWMHRLCFADQPDIEFYGATLEAARQRATSVIFDPPFLGGDRLEIEARHAGWQNLSLATHRLDLLAALLETMRRGHRGAMAALERHQPPSRVFLSGGGADLVRRLLPEYSHGSVMMLEEASLRGAARLFA